VIHTALLRQNHPDTVCRPQGPNRIDRVNTKPESSSETPGLCTAARTSTVPKEPAFPLGHNTLGIAVRQIDVDELQPP